MFFARLRPALDPRAMSTPLPASTDTIDAAAAEWIARRDRGLTAAEQDDYMAWLRADPRHAAAIARHAAVLERMMGLGALQPELSAEPNPDLSRRPPAAHGACWPALALAAALVLGLFVWRSASPHGAGTAENVFARQRTPSPRRRFGGGAQRRQPPRRAVHSRRTARAT